MVKMTLCYRGTVIRIDKEFMYLLQEPYLLYFDNKGYLKFIKGNRNKPYSNKQLHKVIFGLKQILKKNEVVHHGDEDILNIEIANLRCLTCKEHTILHSTDKQHSEKTKDKIRASRLGVRHTEETKQKLSEACKGKHIGEKCGTSKLDEWSVIMIKARLGLGISTQKQIANEFHVAPSTISYINTGTTWRHI